MATVLTPTVVPDEGDVAHALWAEFDDEAHVRFWATSRALVIQAFHSSAAVRGRAMLDHLAQAYGRPIVVVEATPEALGFWKQMQEEGRVGKVHEATGRPSALEQHSVPIPAARPATRRPRP